MARIKYWDEESQTWKYADKSLGPNIDLTEYAKKEDIPEKLPNPNALTITGAVNATYDGSGETTIEIPVNESFGQYGLGETANIVRIPSDYALIDFKKSGWYTVQLDYGTVDFGDGYTANKFLLRVETGECEQYNTVTKQTAMFSSYPGGEEYVRYCKNGDNWTAWQKVIHHPQTLTFTGAVNATYDGSAPVEVAIPDSSQNVSKGWELLTDIVLEEDATIERINYDIKYNYMYGEIIIPKVSEVISTGSSAFFLNAPIYYKNIGSKSYTYRILCYFEKVDDNAFFAASVVGELTGVGGVINLNMRNISNWAENVYSPYKMYFSVALPAGTTIKVYGKE